MKSSILKLVCCLSLAMTAVLNGGGCGGAPQEQQLPADSTVFGTLASSSGSPLMVSLKDSASPPGVHQTTPDADGAYSFDATGLHAPYLLIGEVSAGSSSLKLYSVAATNGRTDITAATTQEFEANHADGGSRDGGSCGDGNEGDHHVLTRAELLTRLQTVLAPLFSAFHVSFPLTQSETSALHALLMEVQFSVDDGAVLVTNRQTRKTIFTGELSNLAAGIFTPANMPVPGGTNACTYTYSAWGSCQSNGTQSRTVVSSTPAGCSGTPVLTQKCTPPPPVNACTYTYSIWGSCQSNGTQSRTVVSSTPAGCSGTPVLTQSGTPPVTSCTYTYSAWGTCGSNGMQSRAVVSSTPAGCTGTPVLTQSCTPPVTSCTYTYSAWGTCGSNGMQSRTVMSSTPAGCTGTPMLSQSCTPPVTNPVTFAGVVSACTSCHGMTSTPTVFRAGGYTVSGRSAAGWLSTVNNMVGIGSGLPPGATAQQTADYLAGVH